VLERFGEVSEVRVRVEKPEPRGLGAAAESVELSLSRELAP
jgi:dihydroneopterin aldolase